MASSVVVSCDLEGCDKKKGSVNHWFKVSIDKGTFYCFPYSDYSKSSPSIKDVCGAEHAMTFFSRFLSDGTLEMTIPDEKV
jgi:hypothetical protein